MYPWISLHRCTDPCIAREKNGAPLPFLPDSHQGAFLPATRRIYREICGALQVGDLAYAKILRRRGAEVTRPLRRHVCNTVGVFDAVLTASDWGSKAVEGKTDPAQWHERFMMHTLDPVFPMHGRKPGPGLRSISP